MSGHSATSTDQFSAYSARVHKVASVLATSSGSALPMSTSQTTCRSTSAISARAISDADTINGIWAAASSIRSTT